MIKTGQVINNTYEVRQPIGEGSAGMVYLAWHIRLQKYVVIKKIKDYFVGHINERHEADILKSLHHRYLPQVYDFIQMGTEVYTIIDYIDGNTMMDYIRHRAVFREAQIVKWTLQLLNALDYLHHQNPPIIHSDIKPSNIMIGKNGDICLIDFNISFGEDNERDASGYSEGYASPEQVYRVQLYSSGGSYRNVRLDARSDIFSLGASIYNLMTGVNPAEILKNHGRLWSGREIYSEQFRNVISRAMERDPRNRYQSADEMSKDILGMKLRDREYQRLKRRQLVFTCVFSALFAVGAVMTWFGFRQKNVESFEYDVKSVRTQAEARSDDYDEIRTEAAEILNNPKYNAARNKDSASVADLYYIIGNTYFEQKDYENAADCFKKALNFSTDNADYMRDYAISLARDGKIKEARDVVDHSGSKILKDENLAIVQGEIALANNDPKTAADELEQVITRSTDSELLYRAIADCADAYKEQNDRDSEFDVLRRGTENQNISKGRRNALLSELGSEYVDEINSVGIDNAGSLVEEATDVYAKLLEDASNRNFTDYYNDAELLAAQKSYAEAQNLLLGAEDKFGENYRFWMEMTNLEMRKQQDVDESVRNYDETRNYYQKAEHYYERVKNDGKEDPEMTELESYMQQLEDEGW